MSPLFGPILAQLVTLAVSDRTEARYIRSDTAYAEAGTYPRVALNCGWQHAALTLGYGPSLNVTPLESKHRELQISQNVAATAAYRSGFRHTIWAFSESVAYSQVNFRQQALAGPAGTPPVVDPGTAMAGTMTPAPTGGMSGAVPGAQPAPGTAVPVGTQIHATDQSITTLISTTVLALNNTVSSVLLVGGSVGYLVNRTVSGALTLPVSQGPTAEAHAAYRASHADSLTTSVTSQYAWTTPGNNAWFAYLNEAWAHALNLRTTTRLGAGASITRNSQSDGLVFWSIYPTFNASINQVVPAGRSTFAFGLAASSAPFIDPIRASVDPRFSVSGTAGWGWGRFSSGLSAGSAVSLAQQNDNGAFNSVYATFNTSYRLGAAVTADAGVRGFWQSVAGQTTVPASLAGYVGFTFGSLAPLTRGR
jgi:hypothetical protein